MIKDSSQSWEIGNKVKVGFLTLQVVNKKETPGDWKPDAYLLSNTKGTFYEFVPHHGLCKLSDEDVKNWLWL